MTSAMVCTAASISPAVSAGSTPAKCPSVNTRSKSGVMTCRAASAKEQLRGREVPVGRGPVHPGLGGRLGDGRLLTAAQKVGGCIDNGAASPGLLRRPIRGLT